MYSLSDIEKRADLCVKCGMCLQQCPTYLKTLDEAESPRGRIALIQGLVSNQLKMSPSLVKHLENCLQCRACEDICPSRVPYGAIMDEAKNYIEQTMPHPLLERMVKRIGLNLATGSRKRLYRAANLLRFYQRSGLRWLAQKTGLLSLIRLRRLHDLLPNLQKPVHWHEYYPPTGKIKGNVALFTGCIAEVMDQTTLQAAIRVLNHSGYGVHVPRKQVCCGALHLHNGEPDQARTLAAANLTAFNPLNVQAIITTSSGCGVMLSEYAKLPGFNTTEQESIQLFERKIMDISTFLYETGWPEAVALKPLEEDVAIHDPCSLRRILRQHENPQHLLKQIPGIRLQPLPGNTQCCGAAGSYMITHPEMSDRLRDDKLQALDSIPANIVVTSNIGCALQLAAGLRKTGKNVEVVHPVVLLDRQLN